MGHPRPSGLEQLDPRVRNLGARRQFDGCALRLGVLGEARSGLMSTGSSPFSRRCNHSHHAIIIRSPERGF